MKLLKFTVFILFLTTQILAKCPEEPCESGKSCDYNTGLCQKFRIPDGFQLFDTWNKCEFVKCPPGYVCDGTSGVCAKIKSSRIQLATDYCDGIDCPPEFSCVTGRCVKGLTQLSNSMVCHNVNCPRGYVCTAPSGVCKPQPAHSDILLTSEQIHDDPQGGKYSSNHENAFLSHSPTDAKCPQNSHFQSCGSPCTFTCTEVKPKCKKEEHECVQTCVCDDGYVQASVLNTTCVPAKDCLRISTEDSYTCGNLQCSQGMTCLNGHCNPENCPQIMKPPINNKCHKLVVVRDRRNCIAIVNECDLFSKN